VGEVPLGVLHRVSRSFREGALQLQQQAIIKILRVVNAIFVKYERVGQRTTPAIEVLDDANTKLGSVASDILGVSGRAMIQALVEGEEDPRTLADLARRQLQGKIPELNKALQGHITEHHRFLLRLHWEELASLENLIAVLDAKIEEISRPFVPHVEQMTEVPGIQVRVAEVWLAEVGADRSPFPTQQQLASWSGIWPG
jgi:transposase